MEKNMLALELDKILELLAKETTCSDAADIARSLEPAPDIYEARGLLGETDAAYVLMEKYGAPSFYGMKNVNGALMRAQAGGGLSFKELLDIAGTLRAVRELKSWAGRGEGERNVLSDRFDALSPNRGLEEEIYNCILSEEEMADTASPELGAIRRKILRASSRVRDELERLVRSPAHQKHLQENIITQRDGRFVVPVKAEYRSEIPGLVHDVSGSGATVFIEPMSVVEANNEIRVLKGEEQEEIDRIVMELSAKAGEIAQSLWDSYKYAVELNVIFAKARLGYNMRAVVPRLEDDGVIVLKSARHPLIDSKKVVPIDVSLGKNFDTLIITGPNTGGKTVVLKTLGLLTLMAMCGLMIPAEEGSRISYFKRVLADIGDEQSIEQSLSTFSAHMTNIIDILNIADFESLVLLDELGAGTDPVEGAALAAAIIEELRGDGVRLACTTHYAELKAYALKTPGVENAACEFDVATLRPTYRLLLGVPGRSNAFAISKRLGMKESVVERAGELMDREGGLFEDVVDRLEESRQRLEDERTLAREESQRASLSAQEAQNALKNAERDAQKAIDDAKREASRIVEMTRRQADELLNELNDLKKRQNKDVTAEEKAKLRAGIKNLEIASDPVIERGEGEYTLPRELRVGDSVIISGIDKPATVLEAPKDGQVLVQAGIIKTRVDIKTLRLEENRQASEKPKRTFTKSVSTPEGATSLDLRGMNSEDALLELDNFLDRASRMGLGQVTVIHGKGTGVLRTAVQQHLKRCPQVKRFRLGTFGEGESGVTVVELK